MRGPGLQDLLDDPPGVEVVAPAYGVLDRSVHDRQEDWEDSPARRPHRWRSDGGQFRVDGRPADQWSRLAAGRSDDLSLPALSLSHWG